MSTANVQTNGPVAGNGNGHGHGHASSGAEAKADFMKRSQENGPKPTDDIEEQRKQGPHMVKDPVTGQQVLVVNATLEDYQGGELDHLDPNDPKGGPATIPAGQNADQHVSKPAPNPARPGNVLIQNFPPPIDVALQPFMTMMDRLQIGIVGVSLVIWFFTAFGSGWKMFLFRSTIIGTAAFLGTTVVSLAQRNIEKEVQRVRMDLQRVRGETFSPPTPESVEWLNAFLKTMWGLVNPDMFVPIADTIEDVMQASLPGFVDAIRISDIGQGTNPVRVISMRALPDQPSDKEYPRKDWITNSKPPGSRPSDGVDGVEKRAMAQGEGPEDDDSGDYVNYEVAVSYQALPGQGNELRAKNIHLLLEFFLGAFDWFHIPVPIWVQVEGFAATIRLRIQFISEPPFVRNLTFTLMGVPAVEVSVVPLISKLPNILDLPGISRFVKMGLAAGTASLVAPKSMTLNIQEMLNAAAIGETQAIGIFIITIHHAEGLSAQDKFGKSDPYITLAYAKFGKPLYSTRIITGDLNPVFEETAFMLVTKNEVQAEEDLACMLWDSDKRTKDDLIGRIQVPIKKLMTEPNVSHRREDGLRGFEDANEMKGKLVWSVGYYEKVPLNKDLERPLPPPKTPAEQAAAAKPSRTAPEMEMRPGDKGPNPAAKDLPPPPPDVQRTPPDPEWPSGVLSVIIHQINGLERQNLKGTTSKDREGKEGQDTDDPADQGDNLPSAYCELVVNDDLVYKTRVKQYSAMPYFEAGTEVFVRNWKNCVVRIVVRDSRLREHDPILGIVDLPLMQVLEEGSEVTRMYSMQEGIGFGRVNVSVLFKSCKFKLPPPALGWDTSTVEIAKPLYLEIDQNSSASKWADDLKATALTISTTDSTEKLSKKDASVDPNQPNRMTWEFDELRLPVYSRFASSVFFSFGSKGFMGSGIGGGEPQAIAVLWLKDLVDDEEVEVEIPVIVGKNLKQLRQNAMTEFTQKTHQYEVIGKLKATIRLDQGLDLDHESNAKQSEARRHAFETYDHIEGEALMAEKNASAGDDGVIDKQEAKDIKAANKRQDVNRQRGIAGLKPYRTLKWMKKGVKDRIHPDKPSKREPTVASET
ncbi:hypothetical protein FRB94_010453 [Tulasnella sp. JGI-2019a]|nr:hypothetical protein FRB94_010453 [Tulasnella sp. JGI-2019a]